MEEHKLEKQAQHWAACARVPGPFWKRRDKKVSSALTALGVWEGQHWGPPPTKPGVEKHLQNNQPPRMVKAKSVTF